jgi:hypothetical protein
MKNKQPQATPKPVSFSSGLTFEDVIVERRNGKFRVLVARFAVVPGTETVIEDGVSLPVARGSAATWRARHGGIGRGLP